MSDEEHQFESKADAGASKTYPQQAGTIRKGGYIVIKGRACKGIGLMIMVLQLAQLPNIKVATALLSCAFCYDIFWVFISPALFGNSVMISAAYIFHGNCKNVMNMSQLDQVELWQSSSNQNIVLKSLLHFR
ncbi:hypothetical protein POM88_000146 [Heracleum sosnowskyi]|uniref:Translation initiation factor 5A-like N-terminal domain-containing protein n=1 Tax=Heracleum sosnowskyi TaxID=360622 RepID=A0AAD8JDC8_9APIA|nr:hypothetical protein POM88_000146 [Heracleum sosnowskyi]